MLKSSFVAELKVGMFCKSMTGGELSSTSRFYPPFSRLYSN